MFLIDGINVTSLVGKKEKSSYPLTLICTLFSYYLFEKPFSVTWFVLFEELSSWFI